MEEDKYLMAEVRHLPKVRTVRIQTRKNRKGYRDKAVRYRHHTITVLTPFRDLVRSDVYDEIRERYSIRPDDSVSIIYKYIDNLSQDDSNSGWISSIRRWFKSMMV